VRLLIRDAEVEGRRASVRVEDGTITHVEKFMTDQPGENVLDASGGALIPGLHDHHVHIFAAAAAGNSEPLGPPDVVDVAAFRHRLAGRAARTPVDQWVRGIGYHESVAGTLDRDALDNVVRHIPVRIQHRSGALWVLNSLGVERLQLEALHDVAIERDDKGKPTGCLWRGDHLLRDISPGVRPDLEAFGTQEAAYGVTGLTDATPDLSDADIVLLVGALASGSLPQRVHAMCPLGGQAESHARVSTGPVKIMLDDSALPSLDELVESARGAYAEGRRVAVHCVTRTQIVLTLAALKIAHTPGGDRIEHAAILPPELDRTVSALGVVLVMQPNFVVERGDDYKDAVDKRDMDAICRCGTLIRQGLTLAAGTDAPFGRADPWATMRAAVERRTASGFPLGAAERINPRQALGLFLGRAAHPGRPRAVLPGEPADLCLLTVPLDVALRELTAEVVRATIVDGVRVYGD
jgi:predicted amidohydrolase YtcJ